MSVQYDHKFSIKTSIRDRQFQQTLEKIKPYLGLAGITRIANITYLDDFRLPVYMTIRPMSKSISTSQGKGGSSQAAMCSAYMEAIEIYFAEEVKPFLRGKSVASLRSEKVFFLDPNCIGDVVYPDSYEHNWVLGENVEGVPIYLPFQYVSMDTTSGDVLFSSTSTTGLASGNNIHEASLHGVLESIERASLDGQSFYVNNLSELEFPLLQEVMIKNNLELYYYLNKYDIPVFKCKLRSKNPLVNQASFVGYGCHLDKEIALFRALTEALQSRATVIAGSRDDLRDSYYNFRLDKRAKAPSDRQVEYGSISSLGNNLVRSLDYLNICMKRISDKGDAVLRYVYLDDDIAVVKLFLVSKEMLGV